jgi:hypothetical protein
MKNTLVIISILLIPFCLLTGCGSAEALEQYNYSTTKFKLEEAVMQVLRNNTNPNLIWDSTDMVVKKYRKEDKDSPGMDTIKVSRYKGEFVWITIIDAGIQNNYAFRYRGNKLDWETSAHSEIFIVDVWNSLGLRIVQGENVESFSSQEATKAKKLFEKEFVSKLDKELNLEHTTGSLLFQ